MINSPLFIPMMRRVSGQRRSLQKHMRLTVPYPSSSFRHHIATSLITEATLSFLGISAPPTTPSLGTLMRIGSDVLFSGRVVAL